MLLPGWQLSCRQDIRSLKDKTQHGLASNIINIFPRMNPSPGSTNLPHAL